MKLKRLEEIRQAHKTAQKTPQSPDDAQYARDVGDLLDEVERLRGCLRAANSNHEEFERRWYLEKMKNEPPSPEVREAAEFVLTAIDTTDDNPESPLMNSLQYDESCELIARDAVSRSIRWREAP